MTSAGPLAVGVLAAAAVLAAPRRLRSEAFAPGGVDRRGLLRITSALRRRRHPGDARSVEEVGEALVLLALGYRSGLPTSAVLEAVATLSPATTAHDLRQVAAALRWGASESDAWGSVDAAWAPAARAVALAHSAGVPPGPLLLRAADDLGLGELERLEVASARVAVRLVLPLGLVLLPAFVLTTVVPIVAALARQVLSAS